jgi:hypothetical protein
MNPESDDLDIPSFLVISQEERAQAWRDWPGFFPGETHANPIIDDRGPGAVCRRLGYLESPADAVTRAEINEGIRRKAEEKKIAGLARLAEHKVAQKIEREEIAAIKAQARERHSEILKD